MLSLHMAIMMWHGIQECTVYEIFFVNFWVIFWVQSLYIVQYLYIKM